MGFSRQEYWSGEPLPSPNKMLVDINPLVSKWIRLETHHPLSQLRKHLDKFRFVATLCNPMNCSIPGFPVLHCLPESAQTHVHWVGDAIQPSHPLLSPSPPTFNLSQHFFSSELAFCIRCLSIGASASVQMKKWLLLLAFKPHFMYWPKFGKDFASMFPIM